MTDTRPSEIDNLLTKSDALNPESKLILLVDDNEDELHLLRILLVRSGYRVITAQNGIEALAKVQEQKPDLVLLDLIMPFMDGIKACSTLKSNYETTTLPVIIISHKETTDSIVTAFDAGADDYVIKPVRSGELIARLKANLRRTSKEIMANPLTRIPGINFLHQQVKKRLAQNTPFALGICDIDNFKAYNDRYGFDAGDKVIVELARILRTYVSSKDPVNCLAHLGGDDFIFLCRCQEVETICANIIKDFDAIVTSFYHQEDLNNGYIQAISRRGNLEYFPVMSLSIGLTSTEDRTYTKLAELAEAANEVKVLLKKSINSNYMLNRRRPGE